MGKKYLIIADKRFGKDSLAEYWRDNFNFKFESSSMAAARIFIFDKLKIKYNYEDFEQCFRDRHLHRAEWYDLIVEYNKLDKTRLAKEILKNNDCYVGMRDDEEVKECLKQGIFDLVIWVDASKRKEREGRDSMKIDESFADIIIDNNGTKEQFFNKADKLGKVLFKTKKWKNTFILSILKKFQRGISFD